MQPDGREQTASSVLGHQRGGIYIPGLAPPCVLCPTSPSWGRGRLSRRAYWDEECHETGQVEMEQDRAWACPSIAAVVRTAEEERLGRWDPRLPGLRSHRRGFWRESFRTPSPIFTCTLNFHPGGLIGPQPSGHSSTQLPSEGHALKG